MLIALGEDDKGMPEGDYGKRDAGRAMRRPVNDNDFICCRLYAVSSALWTAAGNMFQGLGAALRNDFALE